MSNDISTTATVVARVGEPTAARKAALETIRGRQAATVESVVTDSFEVAAREIEALTFGPEARVTPAEVASALRGQATPADKRARILMKALWVEAIPQELKGERKQRSTWGPVRLAIEAAWAEHNSAKPDRQAEEKPAQEVPVDEDEDKEVEIRRRKAVKILRNNGYTEVARMVETWSASAEDRDVLMAAMKDPYNPHGVKEEWIATLVEAIDDAEAGQRLDAWVTEVGTAARLVFTDDSGRQDAFQADAALKRARRVEFEDRHVVAIERMINSGEFPEGTARMLGEFPELAEVVLEARQAAPKTRATTLLKGLRRVVQEAVQVIFDSTAPRVPCGYTGLSGGAGSGKTAKKKAANPNAETERRSRQLERAAECRAMGSPKKKGK